MLVGFILAGICLCFSLSLALYSLYRPDSTGVKRGLEICGKPLQSYNVTERKQEIVV
jgi:hypothetical protein